MKKNPDNRDDNVIHLQKSIDDTVRNIRESKAAIRATSNDKTRAELTAKNARREQAINAFRSEINDEAEHQQRKS